MLRVVAMGIIYCATQKDFWETGCREEGKAVGRREERLSSIWSKRGVQEYKMSLSIKNVFPLS
jgi:hypothetical protein